MVNNGTFVLSGQVLKPILSLRLRLPPTHNYAIKRDLRENTGFKFIIGRVGPLFWLLGSVKKKAKTFVNSFINAAAVIAFSALVINWAVPFAEVWFTHNCRGVTSSLCAATDIFLSYWWIAILILIIPSTAILTIYRNREPKTQNEE